MNCLLAPTLRVAWWSALSLGLVLLPRAAHAAEHIVFSPNQPGHLVLRTSYGVFHSRDSGQTADFLCDQVLGVAPAEARLALSAEGVLLASDKKSIVRSPDGCEFARVLEGSAAELGGVSVDPSQPDHVWAFQFTPSPSDPPNDGEPSLEAWLLASTDNGSSFEPLLPLPSDLVPKSLEVAPSSSDRIYLTAQAGEEQSFAGFLLRWSAEEQSFVRSIIPNSRGRSSVLVAVHPLREDRLYVRVDDSTRSRLLFSDDAGATFREFFQGTGLLPGFAIAADGKEVYFGGPEDGLWAADATGENAQRRSDLATTCLAYGDFALYACLSGDDSPALGRSTDGGRTFTRSLRFVEQCGRSDCPQESAVQTVCPEFLAEVGQSLGVDDCDPNALPEEPSGGAGQSSNLGSGLRASGGCQMAGGRGAAFTVLSSFYALLTLLFATRRRYPRSR